MISIDTEIMRQLVSACSAANDSIDEAVDILNRVTSHNDWGCKERDSINEYTAQNKARIRALQEKSRSFLSVLTSVSHDFENAENSISDMFSTLEGLLGNLIAIPTVGPTAPIATNVTMPAWNPSKLQDIISSIFPQTIGTPTIGPINQTEYFPDGSFGYAIMTADPLSNYSASNLTSDIAVCNFNDINLGN